MEAKKKSWTSALFAYAEGEKSRLLLSVVLSVLSVMLGLVPFYCMYRLICLMAAGTATAVLAVASSRMVYAMAWDVPVDRPNSTTLAA